MTAGLLTAGSVGCTDQETKSLPGGDAKRPATRSAAASDQPAVSPAPGGGLAGAKQLPGLSTAAVAKKQLAGLTVAEQHGMKGYSRARFKHWISQGESCDTRETVLERDGTGVKRDTECKATSGTWVSVYDNKTVTDAGKLDIDHMVPLANAWRSGADTWDDARRSAFANDLVRPQLLAVSAATNRAKGDQGPDEWQPPAATYWCTYATAWTNVKSHYGLTVTAAEKDKLTAMLKTCTS
ncbi:HNH endonuclease family protein [Streptomyces sp. NPDC093225]|uniref:HNH endonuclease family protein n=1 Tax=Streptomyces sp. NPDC093225 TaxID=3366034 RepID=UPI0037F197D2